MLVAECRIDLLLQPLYSDKECALLKIKKNPSLVNPPFGGFPGTSIPSLTWKHVPQKDLESVVGLRAIWDSLLDLLPVTQS